MECHWRTRWGHKIVDMKTVVSLIQRGVKGFNANVLPDDTRMIGLLEKLGFPIQSKMTNGITVVTTSFVERDVDPVGPASSSPQAGPRVENLPTERITTPANKAP